MKDKRVTIERLGSELCITIPVESSRPKMIGSWIRLLIVGASVAVYFLLGPIEPDQDSDSLEDIFVWVFVAVILLVQILPALWRVGGKEVIKLSSDTLRIRRYALIPCFSTTISLDSVSNFRVKMREHAGPTWGAIPEILGASLGRIAFDVRGKTFWIGLDTDLAEAHSLLEEMRRHGYIPRPH